LLVTQVQVTVTAKVLANGSWIEGGLVLKCLTVQPRSKMLYCLYIKGTLLSSIKYLKLIHVWLA